MVEIVLDEPVTARYYKLIPDYAGQTGSDANCPRIYEFQAWGPFERGAGSLCAGLSASAL